ncbi:cupredoxin domain-containing protein [Rhodopila globiformis]|nr:cupredoxin domain-containing protein [Rhodopila globiformis]
MRMIAGALAVGISFVFILPLGGVAQSNAATGAAETITVRMSNFSYDPDHLHLKANMPVRLRLVNDSSGRHDFSAPAFFAASSYPTGSSAPPDGDISVGSEQTVEIALVPRKPGTYPLRCTHFLHSLFGMHGTIEVTP